MKKTDRNRQTKARDAAIRHHLANELLQQARPLVCGTIALVASAYANQALPRVMGTLLDQQQTTTTSNNGRNSDRAVAWVVLGGGLASLLRTSCLGRAQDAMAVRLRQQAWSCLLMRNLEWFQTQDDVDEEEVLLTKESKDLKGVKPADKVLVRISSVAPPPPPMGLSPATIGSILNDDVEHVARALTTTLANVMRSSSSVIFGLYNMYRLDPELLAVSVLVVPLIGAAAILLRKGMQKVTQQQRQLAAQAADYVQERLTYLSMVQSSQRQVDEMKYYAHLQKDVLQLAKAAALQQGVFMGFLFAAASSALLMVLRLGGRHVKTGHLSAGQLTSFCTYTFLLGLGTSGVIKGLSEIFLQGMVSARRWYRLVQADESDTSEKDIGVDAGVTVDVNEIDCVEFHDVSFRYKSTNQQVLNSVSFGLERGQIVGLVGLNGSGKSTIASLLAGILQPTCGHIELSDGTDYAKLSRTSKKQLVQVVPQATVLFNMSILENIRYCQPDATEQQVRKALQMANCDNFVARQPEGIDYYVGLNGCRLSGGERQRLALARALLSDPVVLVMDEPATSMDTQGESAVSDAIRACREGERGGRALLLITHQAKILEHVDTVLVLKDGEIVERGSLEDLQGDANSELRQIMPESSVSFLGDRIMASLQLTTND